MNTTDLLAVEPRPTQHGIVEATPNTLNVGAGSVALSGPSITSYIEPFFAQKWVIVGTLLASLLLGWLTLLVWPRKYESESKLLIRVGRESVSLDPTATTSETMMLQKTQEEEINSTLEVMRSRFLLERTVESIGDVAVIDGYLPGKDESRSLLNRSFDKAKGVVSEVLYQVLLAAGIKDDLSDRELAVMKLDKSLDIYSPKKSAVVIVNGKSRSPEMAQTITKTLVELFQEEHLKTSRTEGSQQFFEQQASEAEQRLNEQLDRRTEMLKEEDIASVESKRQSLLATLVNIESTVRDRLNDLELQEVSLSSELMPNHPKLSRLRRELSDTRQTVRTMKVGTDSRSRVRELPIAQRAGQHVLPTPSGLSAASKQLIAKKRQVQNELRQLMDFQLELDDVDREIQVAQDRLQKLRGKHEEARIIDELQSKRISNVSVVQPASFVERPQSPKKKLLVAGFAAMGLLGGFGLVVLREIGASTFRTVDQLRAQAWGPRSISVPREDKLLSRITRAAQRPGGKLKQKSKLWSAMSGVLSEVTALQYGEGSDAVVTGVIGVHERCGASSVATGLALIAAERGMKATLVDGDSAGRTLSRRFSSDPEKQVGRALKGEQSLENCLQPVGDGGIMCLDAPAAELTIDPMTANQMLSQLRELNDLVVIDLPTVATANRAFDLEKLDSVVLVIEANQSPIEDVDRMVRRLKGKGVTIATMVLNKDRQSVPSWLKSILG